ncbi:hypothetical protein OG205_20460 [Lentzea sp. NBC_00516]|uniref:hypothetical protein n=1 Tax=Lentzea sp. NBC_00516 TaxID=2903582 RepID=UPI002E8069D3|nr:hypothetical protein [Lentzea sp. NBC_00516]WUD29293.1 hypothetical protein OG205_20460 [Lentzea sp. NBC_00516]
MTAPDPRLTELITRSVHYCRQFLERIYPGCVGDHPIGVLPNFEAFTVYHGGALTLAYVDMTNAQPGLWTMQISTGITVDAPEVTATVEWVNDLNRNLRIGKYYSAITQDRSMCAVLYDTFNHGTLFEAVWANPESPTVGQISNWVLNMVKNNVQSTPADCSFANQRWSGKPFQNTDEDKMKLFAISSG